MIARKLIPDGTSDSEPGYDSTVDPSSMIEFVNGGFKTYHALVPDTIQLADTSFNVVDEIPFDQAYLVTDVLETQTVPYLCGSLAQPQRLNEVGYVGAVNKFSLIFFSTL